MLSGIARGDRNVCRRHVTMFVTGADHNALGSENEVASVNLSALPELIDRQRFAFVGVQISISRGKIFVDQSCEKGFGDGPRTGISCRRWIRFPTAHGERQGAQKREGRYAPADLIHRYSIWITAVRRQNVLIGVRVGDS